MVTGRGILFLSDAVAKCNKVMGISMHHEQAAAYAAVAYAQYTGGPGACLVSTGCASTNALTGVLCAWQDNIPCVFVSGQNPLRETTRYSGIPLRTFGSQEADIISIVEPITKYAVMITEAEQIVSEVDKAIDLAQTGRKGPVWLDIPLDIQNMRIEPAELSTYKHTGNSFCIPRKEDIQYVINSLQNAERPVVLIGSGIRSAEAITELLVFVEKNHIPITCAASAVDVVSVDTELSLGTVGSLGGTRAGNFAVQNSDLLLVLGCRLSPVITGSEYEKFAREARIIVVDIDKVEHSKKTIKIDRLIIADVKEFLAAINKESTKCADDVWTAKCLHWKNIFPRCEEQYKVSDKIGLHYLAECLSKTVSNDAVVLCDAGLEELIIPSSVYFREKQRCIHPVSQGAMGFALPASIGAYFASGCQIVVVTGDGSIMMNLQELQTIKYHNIPVKIIVVSNNLYAIIKQRQTGLFRSRTIGTNPQDGISCPSFQKVAECFGIAYTKIEKSEDLLQKLNEVVSMRETVLCEIIGIEDQKYLHSSYTLDSKKKYVKRPIEDQSPFLDRELFLSEMIIDPIDQ
jgi:acetolactate synthase-1/2/3 large subunit